MNVAWCNRCGFTELVQIEWQSAVRNRNETSYCICQNESGEYLNMTDDEFMNDGRKAESVSFIYKTYLYMWIRGKYNLMLSFTLNVNDNILQ
jgi:hypothetical protein